MLLTFICVGSSFGQERERKKSTNSLTKQEVTPQTKSVQAPSDKVKAAQVRKVAEVQNQKEATK